MNIAGIIPDWNTAGVLPPIRPYRSGSSLDRSPYRVSLENFVDRFASSPERNAILGGLLQFREELYHVGIVDGFQWLDGSFLEQIDVRNE